MEFQFDVKLNDQNYFDYHKFWLLRSPYGKKQIRTMRVLLISIIAIYIAVVLVRGGFSLDSFLHTIPVVIALLLLLVFFKRILIWSLKLQLSTLQKSGKMGYSPESSIAFYEDRFVESAPENRTELKYSAVERISIDDGKVIYIHINNVTSYMLPFACFSSKEQYDLFCEFIKTKCSNTDVY